MPLEPCEPSSVASHSGSSSKAWATRAWRWSRKPKAAATCVPCRHECVGQELQRRRADASADQQRARPSAERESGADGPAEIERVADLNGADCGRAGAAHLQEQRDPVCLHAMQ